ncbi:MAG: response regulator transcription factor [Bacteroidota bacterium]
MSNKILLTEDDINFGAVLKSYLELHDYVVTLCRDGNEGYSAFRNGDFDLCILDVMMPNKDGFTLGGEIKAVRPSVPLIYVTAKTMKEDVLEGYRRGADDYITKPFDSDVLLYKIKAVLKRSRNDAVIETPVSWTIGIYTFNSRLRTLTTGNSHSPEQKLSPKEAALLEMLCARRNSVLSRDEALRKIWQSENYFTARSMDVYIAKLRKYLRLDPNIEIVNIHGNGFRLVETAEQRT